MVVVPRMHTQTVRVAVGMVMEKRMTMPERIPSRRACIRKQRRPPQRSDFRLVARPRRRSLMAVQPQEYGSKVLLQSL